MELWCGNGKKSLKSKFELWPFDPNQQRSSSGQGQHICEVSSLYVKWKRSCCTETTFSQTDRQMNRQTDSYGETSIPLQLRWRRYTNLFSMWRNRWKMTPPGGQNFMGKVTFSRPVVQNLMLKFEPCQILTLKNDPGSHFSCWKMTRGVIFQRGHYLMLHRLWSARLKASSGMMADIITATYNFIALLSGSYVWSTLFFCCGSWWMLFNNQNFQNSFGIDKVMHLFTTESHNQSYYIWGTSLLSNHCYRKTNQKRKI